MGARPVDWRLELRYVGAGFLLLELRIDGVLVQQHDVTLDDVLCSRWVQAVVEMYRPDRPRAVA